MTRDRRRTTLPLLAGMLGLVVTAAVIAAAILTEDAETDVPSFAELPTCRAAGITPRSTTDGTCRTANAILTIVDAREALRLPNLRVRVTDVTRRGRHVDVRLAYTVTGDRPVLVNPAGRGVYLVVGGRRVEARERGGPLRRDREVRPGETARGVLRFTLPKPARKRTRAQLGVRGPALSRVGVVRLRLGEPDA